MAGDKRPLSDREYAHLNQVLRGLREMSDLQWMQMFDKWGLGFDLVDGDWTMVIVDPHRYLLFELKHAIQTHS